MTTNPDALSEITFEAKGDIGEVLVYDQIGKDYEGNGLTAKAFADGLAALGKVKRINVRINSNGGSVYDGTAIYNSLKNHPAKVVVKIEGAALSMASVIAMAGDDIEIAKNGFLMIHNPRMTVRGDAAEMRRLADVCEAMKKTLVATYSDRTKQTPEKIAEMMDAETWLFADEAKALGFVDRVTDTLAVAASFDESLVATAPEGFRQMLASANKTTPKKETPVMSEESKPQPATIAEIKANCEGASSEFILAQVEANATLAQAVAAHAKALTAKLQAEKDAHAKQIADAKAAHDKEIADLKAAQSKPGVKPVASGGQVEGEDSDPITAYEGKLIEAKKTMPADKAAAFVARKNPELRAAYIEAVNARRTR